MLTATCSSAPKSVGQKVDYYAFPEVEAAGGESIEGLLGKLESAGAPVIAKLAGNPDAVLAGQDKADLLFFMAFFVIRVPYLGNMVEKFAADTAKMALQVAASHPDYFKRTIREALKDKDELTAERVEEIRKWGLDDSNYTIQASPKLSIAAGFEAAKDAIYPVFYQMNWTVVRAVGDLRLLTSDTPVSWVDPTLPPPYAFGLAARKVEVTFPLDPDVCLLETWADLPASVKAKDRVVEEFNIAPDGFCRSLRVLGQRGPRALRAGPLPRLGCSARVTRRHRSESVSTTTAHRP